MEKAEHIMSLAHDEQWGKAWQAVHGAAPVAEGDERLSWAVSTLTDAFFDRVTSGPMTEALANALETVVLLHSGGLHVLRESRFEAAIVQLVAYHRATGATQDARHYARFCPDAAPCAAVLDGDDGLHGDGAKGVPDPVPDVPRPVDTVPVEHPLSESIEVRVTDPLTDADRATGLFRSPMEQAFFRAARAVFPTYTPVPNVALKAVVDADALKPHLSGAERSFLHTGLVDCVLVDPHDDHRPVAFFELDSTHHDAPDRRTNDAHKDRILALAGHRLYRLRPRSGPVESADFARILRALPGALARPG
jgi:hypothetical protein